MKRLTPKDRLLVFRLSEGWEPLCKHLGKPVPNVPFPHVNEKEWMNEKMAILAKRRLRRVCMTALAYVGPVAAGALGYWYLR